MSVHILLFPFPEESTAAPSYTVGFRDPVTHEKLYLRTVQQDRGRDGVRESYDFSDLEHGEKFPSKTQAKRYLRAFRMNFKEENYQDLLHKPNAQKISLSCYDIKCRSVLFDANEEMMLQRDDELTRLFMAATFGAEPA